MKPLGKVLQQADLISSEQVEMALQEQSQITGLRLGEILALHGWLKQETADFFSQQWPTLLEQRAKQPLGKYLKAAGLLNEQQISSILAEQTHKKLRFGELAVLKGWLKPTTIKFFLDHLALESKLPQNFTQQGASPKSEIPAQIKQLNLEMVLPQQNNLKVSNQVEHSAFAANSEEQESARVRLFSRSTIKLFKLDEKSSNPEVLLAEVLAWTDGQPILTQKLCRLLAESELEISTGTEAAIVQDLVQNNLINNWETQVAADHLQGIANSIIHNQQCHPLLLLQVYQQIWQENEVSINSSAEQAELLRLKLVVPKTDKLTVANRIYQAVFNNHWIEQESVKLKLFRPKNNESNEQPSNAEVLRAEVLAWTNEQPILTQKIYQILADLRSKISANEVAKTVKELVETRLIHNWETQVAAEHLQGIRDSIIQNQQCDPLLMLELYQRIWQEGAVPTNGSCEQAQLLHLGLIVQQQDELKVANRIYQAVFNRHWIEQESIRLRLFNPNNIKLYKLDVKAACPENVISEILSWTDGQPILTQKLCQLLAESEILIPAGAEAVTVQQLVENKLIHNWETQIASEHLQGIHEILIRNPNCDSLLLLELYQQIWQQGEVANDDRSREQTELLRIGLVILEKDKLKLGNRIYQAVFSRNWVRVELEKIIRASLAQTTIYNSVPPTYTWTVNNTVTAPETKGTKRFLVLLAIAALMVCGSSVMVLGFSVFRWLQVETIFKQGNALLQQGKHQEAIDKYNKLLKLDSNYYQSWTNRGYALAGLKDYNQMLESCTTATIINPEAVYAWNCRGEALYNLKQANEAIAAFDKAITYNPKDPVFWINKTEALLAIKQPDTALTTINQAIDLLKQVWQTERKDANAKELAIGFTYQARVLLQKQEYENALQAYEQALKYNPNYFIALRGKGIALQNLKRDDQAIAQFYSLLERPQLTKNEKAEAWYYLGLSLCKFGQSPRAIAAFDEALKLKPDYPAAEQGKKACPN
ncbi:MULTISPECIES: tetratricopeptide repeat protein [unclassified Calothrix]|uniref:tetratricopeptide repeat protein n=1 Tax=unclassified Calothrix TaxID=2619626 RepID=UPI001F553392|nr:MULTISPECIES: tetratricopeptide repeat protein [unclassified Calothrix]